MSDNFSRLTIKQIRQALRLREKIAVLEKQLIKVLDNGSISASSDGSPKHRKMSASARRKIGLAQKARWAKQKGSEVATPAGKARRRMSAAAKARISAAAKKRWAKAKAAGKNSL